MAALPFLLLLGCLQDLTSNLSCDSLIADFEADVREAIAHA
jgi:hypothetical protein